MPRIPGCVRGGGKLSTRDRKKRQTRFEHEESDYLTLSQIRAAVKQLQAGVSNGIEEYATADAFAVEKLNAIFNEAMDKVASKMAASIENSSLDDFVSQYMGDEDFAKDDDTFSFGYGEI